MSNRAHSGRCFRSNRRTARRKERQGTEYTAYPRRWKVPFAILPFLTGVRGQVRAGFEQFGNAIAKYTQHQKATGKGAPIRVAAGHRGA